MTDPLLPQPAPLSAPLPENIRSVQPGGGKCYQIELVWGRLRRWYLKTFRPDYVERMDVLRRGKVEGAPHEILDPRDLKYCCNLCTAYWEPEDDPFRWRESLPFARWGLAELLLMGVPLLLLTFLLGYLSEPWCWLMLVPAVMLGLVVYFFRDPPRAIPEDTDAIVAPADGTIAEITELDHYEFFDGPAVRIGIFLSIFNVHINRAPRHARVVEMNYKPGEFLNAMNPESALRNEYIWIGLEEISKAADEPERKLAVRAISGLIARRIVCILKPGQEVQRGEKFGMIKLGSRTELILPRDSVRVEVELGQKVKAGSTIFARYI